MSTRIVPSRPAGASFKQATATVVRINSDPFVQDYDQSAIDLALVELQEAMFGHDEQDIEMVRNYLDMLGNGRFWLIGLKPRRRTKGTFSDFALAAAMLHRDSPFGIQYRWPDGTTLVMYRGHTYRRDGDTLVLIGDE
ncbi:hypothetical protein [Nocardioides sp.]|uniref:hypothetical protein n=1 Tax=Nocardioides sp. TaxID=35761 RepID=UPI003D11A6DA